MGCRARVLFSLLSSLLLLVLLFITIVAIITIITIIANNIISSKSSGRRLRRLPVRNKTGTTVRRRLGSGSSL